MKTSYALLLLPLLAFNCLDLQPSPFQEIGPLLAAQAADSAGKKFLAFGASGLGLESSGNGKWTKFTTSPAVSLTRVVVVGSGAGATLIGTDGSTNNTIYKSTDLGRSWTSVSLSLSISAPVLRLAACGQKVMAVNANGQALDGVFSADGGSAWSASVNLIAAGGATSFAGLACDSVTGRFHAMRTSINPTHRYSDAPGTAWSTPAVDTGLMPILGSPFAAARNGVVLYVAQSTGPEIGGSSDGGVNYTASTFLAPAFPTAIVLNDANSNFRVVSVVSPTCTFYRSAAGTSGWTNVALGSCAATALADIVGDGNQTLITAGTATSAPFLARSTDNGLTWTAEDLSSITGASGLNALVYVP